MAKLYLTEFAGPGMYGGGIVPVGYVGVWTENANSPMGITASATTSAVFATNTSLVRVHVDATCSIKIGVTATATANNARMIQNQTEYFQVTPGQVISVITNS